jgi:hypothetical protein
MLTEDQSFTSTRKALLVGCIVLLGGVGPAVVSAWDEPKGVWDIPWASAPSLV